MEMRHEVSITFTTVPFFAFHYHYVLWQQLSYFIFELKHFCYVSKLKKYINITSLTSTRLKEHNKRHLYNSQTMAITTQNQERKKYVSMLMFMVAHLSTVENMPLLSWRIFTFRELCECYNRYFDSMKFDATTRLPGMRYSIFSAFSMNSVYRTLHIFIYLLNANRWAINTSYQQYH